MTKGTNEFRRSKTEMHEVTETSAVTFTVLVLTTACFAEIRHGREFAVYRAAGVPAAVQCIASFLGVFLVFEADVDVADEICCEVHVSQVQT